MEDNIDLNYQKANESDSFKIHNDVLNQLLLDTSNEGMEKHYQLFQDTHNTDLKRILGKGFLKRGESGLNFLSGKLNDEKDSTKKSNVIHLLGLSGVKKYLSDITPYLDSKSYDLRYKTIVAIGWLGDTDMIAVLQSYFSKEKELDLRCFLITAMRQIYFRIPSAKDLILPFLYERLKSESNEQLIAVIIVVIQDLTKIKYGLKEDPNSGEILGNILGSKEKIIKKLNLL